MKPTQPFLIPNTDPAEQWVYYHAGLASSGSGSYIDGVILCDRDTTGNGTLDERLYYLQNWRSDVVALITDTGDQREQVRYEPYGTPFGLPAGDIDSDGDFDATDYAGITGAYDVRKDVNMDGSITFADTTAAYNINGLHTMGRGVASSDAVLNRKGYAGYEHLSELAGAKWDVRNRVLLSELGTWNRRDPLGYVDGGWQAHAAGSACWSGTRPPDLRHVQAARHRCAEDGERWHPALVPGRGAFPRA